MLNVLTLLSLSVSSKCPPGATLRGGEPPTACIQGRARACSRCRRILGWNNNDSLLPLIIVVCRLSYDYLHNQGDFLAGTFGDKNCRCLFFIAMGGFEVVLSPGEKRTIIHIYQCSRSDPYLWLTDPDPVPAVFVSDLPEAKKIISFLFITFWRYIFIILHRKKVMRKSQDSRNQRFKSYYFCLMMEGSRSGIVPLTNGSRTNPEH